MLRNDENKFAVLFTATETNTRNACLFHDTEMKQISEEANLMVYKLPGAHKPPP